MSSIAGTVVGSSEEANGDSPPLPVPLANVPQVVAASFQAYSKSETIISPDIYTVRPKTGVISWTWRHFSVFDKKNTDMQDLASCNLCYKRAKENSEVKWAFEVKGSCTTKMSRYIEYYHKDLADIKVKKNASKYNRRLYEKTDGEACCIRRRVCD